MSGEFFNQNVSVFGQIENLWMEKMLRRVLHQIQGKWGGKNFRTVSRVNSRLITHPRIQRWIWNLQLPKVQLSNNKFINGGNILDDNAWPGLTVKYIFFLYFEYRTEISFLYMHEFWTLVQNSWTARAFVLIDRKLSQICFNLRMLI